MPQGKPLPQPAAPAEAKSILPSHLTDDDSLRRMSDRAGGTSADLMAVASQESKRNWHVLSPRIVPQGVV